jgi:MarR family transcriptional regulator, 2-MHQ and catechol-resistance regulon repressor
LNAQYLLREKQAYPGRMPPSPIDNALLSTFGRLLEAASHLERELGRALEAQTGLPHAWFEVLIRLARSDGGRLTMGALAKQVTLTTGGTTRLVDRMEAAGYVERRSCPVDRRVAYAAITEAGRAKLDEAARLNIAHLEATFTGFDAEDLATLDALLDRLRPTGE